MTANARATFPAPATGTPPRSCGRIFTCGEAQIATLPFVYRCMGIFMPEKLGNLQCLNHPLPLRASQSASQTSQPATRQRRRTARTSATTVSSSSRRGRPAWRSRTARASQRWSRRTPRGRAPRTRGRRADCAGRRRGRARGTRNAPGPCRPPPPKAQRKQRAGERRRVVRVVEAEGEAVNHIFLGKDDFSGLNLLAITP